MAGRQHAVAVSPTVSTLLQLALSRNREYTADLEAVALTGDARGLASALELLERDNSSWLRSVFGREPVRLPWLQTHPPTAERIRRLLELSSHPDHEARGIRAVDPFAAEPMILHRPAGRARWYLSGPWR